MTNKQSHPQDNRRPKVRGIPSMDVIKARKQAIEILVDLALLGPIEIKDIRVKDEVERQVRRRREKE